MKHIVGLLVVLVALAACGVVAQAQQPKKVSQIGYLSATDPASESTRAEAIRLALRDLGYVEGQNIAIDRIAPSAHHNDGNGLGRILGRPVCPVPPVTTMI